jgi:hypothetical protein
MTEPGAIDAQWLVRQAGITPTWQPHPLRLRARGTERVSDQAPNPPYASLLSRPPQPQAAAL